MEYRMEYRMEYCGIGPHLHPIPEQYRGIASPLGENGRVLEPKSPSLPSLN